MGLWASWGPKLKIHSHNPQFFSYYALIKKYETMNINEILNSKFSFFFFFMINMWMNDDSCELALPIFVSG